MRNEEECTFVKDLKAGRVALCLTCRNWVWMHEPWKHEEQYGHAPIIEKDDRVSFWRAGRPPSGSWIRITRWMRARAWVSATAAWRWGKLVGFSALLFALWGFVCIHLEPVIHVDQTWWWKIHELHASIFSSYDFEWGDFLTFWTVRLLVFAFNAGWFIFWTWMFLANEKLKAFMRNLEQQCSRR